MKNIQTNGETQTPILSLATTAWIFTRCLLWNMHQFSKSEEQKAREQILALLQGTADNRKGFTSFCQRVLLAQKYLERHEGRYLPLPTQWLHPGNEQGFAGTRQWLQRIDAVRASLPCYRQELKAMAEAVLEMHEDPSPANYLYWCRYFIQCGQTRLLEQFQQCLAQLQWDQISFNHLNP